MNAKFRTALSTALILFFLAACKGGSGGGGDGGTTPSPPDGGTPVAGSSQVLLGPLSGAEINAYLLSDLSTSIETVQSQISLTDLSIAGSFDLALENISNNVWVLVTATGGQDIDADDDGVIDSSETTNSGTLHALAMAADWRTGGKLNILTEVAWQQVSDRVTNGQVDDLESRLQWIANGLLLGDLNQDSEVNYKDLVSFSPLTAAYQAQLSPNYSAYSAAISAIHINRDDLLESEIRGIFADDLTYPMIPDLVSVTLDIQMPENRLGLTQDNAVVSSFASDIAQIPDSAVPSVLMAENSEGKTLLLGIAVGGDKKIDSSAAMKTIATMASVDGTEMSPRSTALTLVYLAMGDVTASDRSKLLEMIVDNEGFGSLAINITNAFVSNPYFLETIMENQSLVTQIRDLAEIVHNIYMTELEGEASETMLMRMDSTSLIGESGKEFNFLSPWRLDEPWTWYDQGTTIINSPFIAQADNPDLIGFGNPTMVNYAAQLYSNDGTKVDWLLVPRSSTIVQWIINSHAAPRTFKTSKSSKINKNISHVRFKKFIFDYDESDEYKIITALNSMHLMTSVVGFVFDATALKEVNKRAERRVKTIPAIAKCGEAMANTIDYYADEENPFRSFIKHNAISATETFLTGCVPDIARAVGFSINDISNAAVKSAIKSFVKKASPAGWVSLVIDAGNDLIPVSSGFFVADGQSDYDLLWNDEILNGVVENDALPAPAVEARIIDPKAVVVYTHHEDLSVTFDASRSLFDPNSTKHFEWGVGDGSIYSTESFTHTYSSGGLKDIRLTLWGDDYGKRDEYLVKLMVTNGRSPVINNMSCTSIGENSIQIEIDATDPDGDISNIRWYKNSYDEIPDRIDAGNARTYTITYESSPFMEVTPKVKVGDRGGNSSSAACTATIITPVVGEMAHIPAGSFLMGNLQTPYDDESREHPIHTVSVPSFKMARYEVTFDQFDRFCIDTGRGLHDDWGWGREDRPALHINPSVAVAYTEWLSDKTGRKIRLPTEAEWEYAARAGTKTNFWWGNETGTNNTNCQNCESQWYAQSSPVGSFLPNPWGLYDIHGNVSEIVLDCWHSSYNGAPTDGSAWLEGGDGVRCDQRIVRGGRFIFDAESISKRNRANVGRLHLSGLRSDGFRIVEDYK